jgi:hypothetical protein
MNQKSFFLFIIATTILLISSCGVLLGPVSELSLQQRMSKGWIKIYEFTQINSTSPILANSKLLLTKMSDGIRGYYMIGDIATRQIYYFNTNSSSNYIYSMGSSIMPNKLDVSYEGSNNSLIFADSSGGSLFNCKYNYVSNWTSYSTYFNSGFNILAASNDTIISALSTGPSNYIFKTSFFNPTLSNVIYLPNALGINNLSKCKNKYNGDTLISAVYYDPTNSTTQMELVALSDFSAFIPSTPFNMGMTYPSLPIIESDGADKLYMLFRNNIYRFNSGTGSFTNENVMQNNFMTSSSNSVYSANFIGDNMIVLYFNGDSSSNPVKLWSYNTSSKSFGDTIIMQSSLTESVIGLDMYYDTDTLALYVGLIYYNTNGHLRGVLYLNQM